MLDAASLADLRARTVSVVRDAGELVLEGFRGAAGVRDDAVREKGVGGDLVTEHDEKAERFLRERLLRLVDGAAFVGEESGGEPGTGLAWYVDPIDGTGNFAHGHPWFSISVGLWDGASPLLGVVHAPAMGLTFEAARGSGLFRNGRAARVSGNPDLSRALLATGFPHDRATRPDNNYRAYAALDAQTHGVRRCASAALELALVADGAYDGFWDSGLGAWDVAGAIALLLEAGGRVTDLSGEPFVLARRVEILASNGLVHGALADALAHARALPPIHEVP
ncbi:MAG: inositol monophosphatase family protein [Sandaracinaceae bacterium]